MMKAVVYTEYGSPAVLQVKTLEIPVPKDHELLIKVNATAVNSGDVRLRKADPFAVRFFFGLWKPKIQVLGAVFAGEVVAVGKQVKLFKVGDAVFGHTDMRFGAYAAYLCFPENGSIALKPVAITNEAAAVVPFGGVTALHFIKKAMIKPSQKVLVVGASGAVGSAAVQIASSYGANVTGVCSTANKDLVLSIGANKVIDYTKEDFTQQGEVYDVIFDAVNTISIARSLHCLAKNGTMILSAAGMSEMLQGALVSAFSKRKVLTGVISHQATDILFLKSLIEAGKYQPIIDKTFSLDEITAAHAYVEQGHKKGNVAVTL